MCRNRHREVRRKADDRDARSSQDDSLSQSEAEPPCSAATRARIAAEIRRINRRRRRRAGPSAAPNA